MSVRLSRRSALFASGGAAALASRPAWAQTPANDDAGLAETVDAFVRQCMAAWPEQPALGIAVVRDGRPVLARGYGVKRQGRADRRSGRVGAPTMRARACSCGARDHPRASRPPTVRPS